MIPGIVAAQWHGSAPVGNLVVWPLTYDEQDADGGRTLTRTGGLGPHVTPDGFEGDGYSASYYTTSIPSFVGSGPLTIAARVRPAGRFMRTTSTREVFMYAGDASTGIARLSLERLGDPNGQANVPAGIMAARTVSGGSAVNLYVGRPGWKYENQVPNLTIGGLQALTQGIVFLDEDNYLFNVHVEDTQAIVYKYNIPSKSIVGSFTFGTSTHRHITCMCMRGNGDVWMGDYETAAFLRVDVDASLLAGTAVILQTVDASAIFGAGSLEFCTIAGTEYFVASGYDTADTNGWLYFFPATVMSGSSIVLTDRTKRFKLGRRIQGVCVNAAQTKLYLSRNNLYGSTGTYGSIQELDLAALFALAAEATVNSTTNSAVFLDQWNGPSEYPEDLAFQPNTGILFCPTEGAQSVGDFPGYLGVWSWNLSGDQENLYEVGYDGSSLLTAHVNGFSFGTAAAASVTQTVGSLSVGAIPGSTAGQMSSFCFGMVNNFAIADHPLTSTERDDMMAGAYEPNDLTVTVLPLVNGDAEAGNASSWTSEIGSMDVRQTNPPPYDGSYYFFAGPNATTLARQRINLATAGVTPDTDSWAKIRWRQSAFGNQDSGGMGMRFLDTGSTVSTNLAAAIWTLGGPGRFWYPRSLPVQLSSDITDVDALYNAPTRTGGTNYDLYIDAIKMVVYSP